MGKIANVVAIYRYPVKGFTPERLPETTLIAGQTITDDRIYAIENGPGRFDPASPKHLPKVNFLMLMRNERIANLETSFNSDTHVFTISRKGTAVATGALNTSAGRAVIAQFLSAYFEVELRGPPRIVSAANHSFSDVAEKCLHIINLASVRDLERVTGKEIDPRRFRPNVVIDTGVPWQEFDWIGQDIRIGDAVLTVTKRTQRCAAINVDPQTGERDIDLPVHLKRNWKHTDFGAYAVVKTGGAIADNADVAQPGSV